MVRAVVVLPDLFDRRSASLVEEILAKEIPCPISPDWVSLTALQTSYFNKEQ